jgi:hypothetical protein
LEVEATVLDGKTIKFAVGFVQKLWYGSNEGNKYLDFRENVHCCGCGRININKTL